MRVIYLILSPLLTALHLFLIYLTVHPNVVFSEEKTDTDFNLKRLRFLYQLEFTKSAMDIIYLIDFMILIGGSVILHPAKQKHQLFWGMKGKLWHIIDLTCLLVCSVYVFLRWHVVNDCYSSSDNHITTDSCAFIIKAEGIIAIRLLRLLQTPFHIYLLVLIWLENRMSRKVMNAMICLHALVEGMSAFETKLKRSGLFQRDERTIKRVRDHVKAQSAKIRSVAHYYLVLLQAQYPTIKQAAKVQTAALCFLKDIHEEVETQLKVGEFDEEEADILEKEIKGRLVDVLGTTRGIRQQDLLIAMQGHPVIGDFASEFLEHAKPTLMTVKPGTVIMAEGEAADSVYWLHNGAVAFECMRHSGYKMVHAGQLLGQISFLLETPRKSTVTAVTTCEIYRFDEDNVNKALGRQLDLKLGLLQEYSVASAMSYLQELPRYQLWTHKQLYLFVGEFAELIDLHMVRVAYPTTRFSMLLLIDGMIKDGETDRDIDVNAYPLEITCESVKNAVPSYHCLILGIKRGDTFLESAHMPQMTTDTVTTSRRKNNKISLLESSGKQEGSIKKTKGSKKSKDTLV